MPCPFTAVKDHAASPDLAETTPADRGNCGLPRHKPARTAANRPGHATGANAKGRPPTGRPLRENRCGGQRAAMAAFFCTGATGFIASGRLRFWRAQGRLGAGLAAAVVTADFSQRCVLVIFFPILTEFFSALGMFCPPIAAPLWPG